MLRRRRCQTRFAVLFRDQKFEKEIFKRKLLNTNKEIADINILRYTNKNQIRNLGEYLNTVNYNLI